MIDSAPIDEWTEKISAFGTFGPGSSTGYWVLTVLGMIVTVAALIGWVIVEHRKLTEQAERLRAIGAIPEPEPGPRPAHMEPGGTEPTGGAAT